MSDGGGGGGEGASESASSGSVGSDSVFSLSTSFLSAPAVLQFNRTGRGSLCSQAIMLVTDGATQMYDDVFEKYNWPERKVGRPVGLQ